MSALRQNVRYAAKQLLYFLNYPKGIFKMKTNIKKNKNAKPKTKPNDCDESILALAEQLYETVPMILDVVEGSAKKQQGAFPKLEDVIRGMLLGGAGRGFEPAIRHAIRFYVQAFKELRKWKQMRKEVPDDVQTDSLAAWTLELRERAEQLKLLDVQVVAVEPGETVDEDLHSVNSRDIREADRPAQVGTIAEVIAPAFRWRDGQGYQVVTHAEVVAFVKGNSTQSSFSKERSNRGRGRKAR